MSVFKNTNVLTDGTPWKKMLRFAVPLFLGNIIQQLYNTVDAAVAGRFIGPHALAAVGSNMPIIQIAIALFFGISMGANVLISQNFGAKNNNELRRIVDTFMIFVYVSSLCFTFFGLLAARSLHKLLSTPLEILPHSISYLNIILIGIIAMFGYNAVSATLRGVGDTKTPLLFLIISSVLNVILDILFVTVFNFGVKGLALATVFSQALSFIFGVFYINKKHPIIGIHFRHAKFKFRILKDLVIIGFPSGMQGTFIAAGMFVIQSLVNSFGYIVMAGYNAAMRIEMIATLPAQNFGLTLATFVGQNIGAGKWDRVKTGFNSALLMSSTVCLTISIALLIFAKYALMIFTKDTEVIKAGVQYLTVVSPFYVVVGYLFALLNGVRGSGATFMPMLISLVGQVVFRIPLAYLFVYLFKSPIGVWFAIPVSWVSGAILGTIYYRSGKWKNHVRIKKNITTEQGTEF